MLKINFKKETEVIRGRVSKFATTVVATLEYSESEQKSDSKCKVFVKVVKFFRWLFRLF